MITLRNLMDVLQTHAGRLSHMLDRPIHVKLGGSDDSEVSSCLVTIETDRTLLYFTMPEKVQSPNSDSEPKPASDEVTLSTMHGSIKVKRPILGG